VIKEEISLEKHSVTKAIQFDNNKSLIYLRANLTVKMPVTTIIIKII
jgi:hypothetical protein